MIKPDHWIRAWGEAGGVDPFEPDQVNAASYDVRVGDHWICPTRDPEEFHGDRIKLFPNEVVLATTLEFVRIPRSVACDLKLKSTLGRLWINHSLAGWCDPGFEGNITLELQNLGPVPFVLDAGRRIAQLIFIAMESEPQTAYGEPGAGSRYQHQRGATRARS
ncbi:MAG: dCTP deaminase [Holophagales bacterium]|nr:dCTP deaminase [Holophagales bacterium]MXX60230.1 dCTP deaminase [Holophagales bacterium]MYC11534.1 dCTP deaminase [Holophagales bacterium]MYD20816.1 dCTP deaminase [Holophagales bacterium]MYI33709.1 dCTP deaminase [Holophagales bacterium]